MKFQVAKVGVFDCYNITKDRYRRTWQAEWINRSTGDYCDRAVRAYTVWGVLRKARRAYRKANVDVIRHA